MQCGRKSSAELATVSRLTPGERIAPPNHLSASEVELWRSIVATKPNDWWNEGNVALLIEYIRAIETSNDLAARIREAKSDKSEDGEKRYGKILYMQNSNARTLVTLAAQMRVTQQSQYQARGAHTHAKKVANSSPWEK